MEKTRILGHTDIEITAIGYGCMGQTHSYGVVEPEKEMVELMRYAYEVGYTFFDTAPIYGEENEKYLGKAIQPCRDKVVLPGPHTETATGEPISIFSKKKGLITISH